MRDLEPREADGSGVTAVKLIGSTYQWPCIDRPCIDMPRLGSTSRGHMSICHAFHFHVTHITIRDGTITPRIPLL
jgi:hypothetical protein